MSFRPNPNGPSCPMGKLIVAAAGTGILFNDNWSPKFDSAPVTVAAPQQYAIACADIIINPLGTNAGALYVVTRAADGTFSKNNNGTVVAYIPKGSGPYSMAQSLGSNRFAPEYYALDAEQNEDGAEINGTIL